MNKLADYLFSLREQKEPLSNHQALQIMRLWNNLSEFDKKPTVPLPRHKARLTTGSATTFKVRSKSTCVPGVDSVKRAFHGSEGGVAQRPDSNRYMELLIIKLCEVHPSTVKVDQKRIDRWNLVGRDYCHIRELISMNPLVNKVTLYSINNATLLQWYNKRTKTQDREMLERNITMTEPKMTSDTPVPAAQVMVPVTERPPVPQDQQHTFTLPPYTVGTSGRVKRQLIQTETPANPESDFQRLPINFTGIQVPQGLDPIQQLIFQPVVPQLGTPVQPMARTTEWYKRKKQEKKASGQTIRENKVRRENKMYTCSKCKQPRDKENHPTQVQGKWYCRLTATESLEEFLARNKPKENRSRKRKLEPEPAEDPE